MDRRRKNKHTARASARRRSRRFSKPGYHHLLNVTLLVCACVGIYYFSAWLKKPSTFTLDQINVSTNAQYVSLKDLKSQIKKQANGGFFNYDLDKLKQSLLSDPWIENVTIRKIFPHGLKVNVIEKQPLALWNKDGIIDRSGQVFYPNHIPALSVPHFLGTNADIPDIHQHYISLEKKFSNIQLTISSLSINPQGQWSLTLSNGIQLTLGAQNLIAKCQRFVEAYPELHNHNMKIQSVDLRYADGFAVKWVIKNKTHQKTSKA
jgi:cell division protein FtsQ